MALDKPVSGANADEFREAMVLLLENYWLTRDEQPESYRLIRRYEPELRRYFFDKCGWRLVQHPEFYKLEKIPAQAQNWMGISEFQQPRDYAIFCCLMAFLEEKESDEQFLLSDLCDSILALYPHEVGLSGRLNWENYEHRRSLVRVLAFATGSGLIYIIDGDSEQFALYFEGEALYEVSVRARYFLRSYPKDLQQVENYQDLALAEVLEDDAVTGRGRRVRIYRQLMLTPVYTASDAPPEDFAYLRNMQRRLREELEANTGLQLEVYKDCAMLTSPERTSEGCQFFPYHRSGIHAVVLHFAAHCQKLRQANQWQDAWTAVEFEKMAGECRAELGMGWTKEYRELSLAKLAANLLAELIDWGMAAVDSDTGLIEMRPALGRLVGRYPDDYQAKSRGLKSKQEEPNGR